MTVVQVFELGGWDASEFVEQTSMVEPVDPFQGGEFEVVETARWSFVADEFGLVEPVDRLGEGVDAPIGQDLVSGRDEAGPVCRREPALQVMVVSWFVRGGRS